MIAARNKERTLNKDWNENYEYSRQKWSVFLSQTRHARVQLIMTTKKTNLNKEKLKSKCKTLQAKHITHEVIKIVWRKMS